ncbi:transglycosylase family protein [Kitasatospora sp. NPDC058162]|uniref:transglycosylase family protein n=1 Tax=Kitasatospora sp. NPDC058162 TaxID=3346362 RepID=UPI0036DB41E2
MPAKPSTPSATARLGKAALLVACAAAAAAPVLTAGTASAASVTTWDRVAMCESTGNWSIVSANGLYYGGLQFSSSTWKAYGGTDYAPQANLATKYQQIAIAEKVLADQGPGAWPVCSVKAGLTKDGPAPAFPTATKPLTYSGDLPVSGRWSNGSATTVGVFRDGTWALRDTNGNTTPVGFGQAGDLPMTGDFDGVGHDQLGIFRPSTNTFTVRHDDASATSLAFGQNGDIPVPGMWDHNGHAQMAVYRPGTGTFIVRHDDGSVSTAALGQAGDTPIVGDWDGVGHTQMGVFRPGTNTGDQNVIALRHDDGSVTTAAYGVKGDLPVTGDWANKGRTTYGVYRPGNATFALSTAYAGTADSVFTYGNGGTWS